MIFFFHQMCITTFIPQKFYFSSSWTIFHIILAGTFSWKWQYRSTLLVIHPYCSNIKICVRTYMSFHRHRFDKKTFLDGFIMGQRRIGIMEDMRRWTITDWQNRQDFTSPWKTVLVLKYIQLLSVSLELSFLLLLLVFFSVVHALPSTTFEIFVISFYGSKF